MQLEAAAMWHCAQQAHNPCVPMLASIQDFDGRVVGLAMEVMVCSLSAKMER